jgi:hypothetical protein
MTCFSLYTLRFPENRGGNLALENVFFFFAGLLIRIRLHFVTLVKENIFVH